MNRKITVVAFLIVSLSSFGQSSGVCDTVYDSRFVQARYKSGEKGIADYVNKVLIPLLMDCPQRRGENDIDRVVITFTIGKDGEVLEAVFPKLQISDQCKTDLEKELLSMKGWLPGENAGKPVCSKYALKFDAEEIDKGLGTY